MPPRTLIVPRASFAFHSKHLRCCQRFASSDAATIWRGQDPITRLGQSITGTMEWQTSTYSFNKQISKTLPVAATNVEKLIKAYVTMADVDTRAKDARAIRNALNARRKGEFRTYISKPRMKDFGDRVEIKVFTYQNKASSKDRTSSSSSSSSRSSANDLEPAFAKPSTLVGIESLLSKMYGKSVTLTFVPLRHPHLDADILASLLAQRLKDRRNNPSRVTRDAAWKPSLPEAEEVSAIRRRKQLLLTGSRSELTWRDMTLGRAGTTTSAGIVGGLGLSRVTSIQASAGGRLTKRMTANRAEKKMARNGATAKGEGVDVLGHRKAHVRLGFAAGKRRVGQYGVKVRLGHS